MYGRVSWILLAGAAVALSYPAPRQADAYEPHGKRVKAIPAVHRGGEPLFKPAPIESRRPAAAAGSAEVFYF